MFEFFMSLVGDIFGIASFRLSNLQAKSEVISSLRHALRLTRSHIEQTRVGEFGDDGFSDQASQELSQAWVNVAQAVRPFDVGLANTFESKSDYWINPWGFREDIENGNRKFNYKFRLHEVEKELAKLESNYK